MTRLDFSIKKAIAVLQQDGKKVYSKSPKATGVAGQFHMTSPSGLKVHSYSHQSHPKTWGPKEHMEAYRAHAKHVSQLDPGDTHKGLIQHHKSAMTYHWQQANKDFGKSMIETLDLVLKAMREKVYGHTRSGKKIYHHHGHHSHKHFSSADHKDAAHLHHGRAMKIMDKMMHTHKHKKLHSVLQKLLDRHSENAHGHHSKAHGGKHG